MLRDTLLRPMSESLIPTPKVSALLSYHVARLQKPWEPFGPKDSAARTALSGPSVTLPSPSTSSSSTSPPKFDVDKASRSIALRLSDATGVNEITAFALWKSYASHSIEDPTPQPGQTHEDAVLDRLMLWYEQELLAVPQIVMALYVPAAEPTGWEDLAAKFRDDVLGDQAAYIEGLFRAFSTIAQKPVETDFLSRGLYW